MYKNIVFDVDGTLLNSVGCAKKIYRQLILEGFGKTISDEELANGMKWPTIKALEVLGFQNVPEALKKYHANLMQEYMSVNVYEGMEETLAVLKSRNILLNVVTARNKSELDDDVAFQRILNHFDFIICANDTKKYKPDPDPLLLFLEKSNARAGETFYIGDTYNDFLCAKNAGIDFGLALWGAETRKNIDAEYFLGKPEEILNILE